MISRAVLGFHCHGFFVRLCHIPEWRAPLTAFVGALYEGVSEHRAASRKCTMQCYQRHQRFPGRALGLLLSVSLGPLAHLGNLFADEVQESPGRASASNRISQTGTEQRVADAGAAHALIVLLALRLRSLGCMSLPLLKSNGLPGTALSRPRSTCPMKKSHGSAPEKSFEPEDGQPLRGATDCKGDPPVLPRLLVPFYSVPCAP